MKKIIKYFLIGINIIVVSSCDLDKYPYSEVASKEYVKDDSSVENLLIGTYNSLHDVMYYEWALTELRSDNSRMYATGSSANDTKIIEQLDQNVVQAANEWIGNYWNSSYVTISRANNVLSYLDKISNENTMKQIMGEALFLRSLIYFNLVRLWGPVFIITGDTDAGVARKMQRSSESEVYDLIENDLNEIVSNNLLASADTYGKNDKGRASMEAAKFLLAKVYVTRYKSTDSNYAKSIPLLKEVLNSTSVGNPQSSSDLVPYNEIFSTDNEMNKEIIFAVRYKSGNYGLGSPFGNLFAPLNSGSSVIVGSSKGYNTPTDNLISVYGDGDARLDVNIAQKYLNTTTNVWVTTGNCRYTPKFISTVTTDYDGENDWPVLRVGDAILLLAEALNETQGPSNDALKYLNIIRERANVKSYTLSDLSTKYDFRVAVRNERRLELAMENQRWFDLARWGETVNIINKHYRSEVMYSEYNYEINDIQNYQVLLPIPTSVLNINPDVAQNAGY